MFLHIAQITRIGSGHRSRHAPAGPPAPAENAPPEAARLTAWSRDALQAFAQSGAMSGMFAAQPWPSTRESQDRR